MPVRIEYTKDNIGVILYSEGIVTGKELISAIKDVYSDDRYLSLKYWIGDRTNCTEYLPSVNHLKEIAALNEKESLRNPGILLALVSPDNLTFGVSRQFEVFGEDSSYISHVFRDRQSADQWIRQNLKKPDIT